MRLHDDDAPVTRVRDPVLMVATIVLFVWGSYPVLTSLSWGRTAIASLVAGFLVGVVAEGATLFTAHGRRFRRWSRDPGLSGLLVGLVLLVVLWGLLAATLEPPWPPVLQFGCGYLLAIPVVQIAELLWFRRRSAADSAAA